MKKFESALAAAIAGATGLPAADVERLIAVPKDPKMGDLAFPCFALAKSLGKAPPLVAKEVAAKAIEAPGARDLFVAIEAAGPFVNARLQPGAFARAVLDDVRAKGERYGHSDEGAGRTVPIDYSSPNIAKRFHVGHIRSTVIGGALYRIYAALGYKPVGINHLGDWGTQFGHLVSAWTKWGDEAKLAADPIGFLSELYVRHNAEAEKDPGVAAEARAWFKKLEDGDPVARGLWQRFRDLSLADFKKFWDLMGTRHDVIAGESFYEDKMGEALDLVAKKGIAEESKGALIIDFKKHGVDIAEPMLLRRSDGGTLYATRDLAAAIYRFRTYDPARLVYVIGSEQALAMRQLFAALTLLGFPGDRCVHVSFGRVQGMSTRKGTVVLLDEILGRAIELARAEVLKQNEALGRAMPADEVDRVARQIGVGGVIFADLKNRRVLDYEFDWDRFCRLDGDTGPYLQYTVARLHSLLAKLAEEGVAEGGAFDAALLSEPETLAVLKAIESYPRKIAAAASESEPSIVAKHLLDVAGAFNGFYNKHRVKDAPTPEQRTARAALVAATRLVLRSGLGLLGIEAPERM